MYVDKVYAAPGHYEAPALLLATFAFAWQIYFDFSGYTDMARGIARMMGIRLMLNFNNPYLADGLGDFWTRWHISLSTWFKDYVYIPLGGNRRGNAANVPQHVPDDGDLRRLARGQLDVPRLGRPARRRPRGHPGPGRHGRCTATACRAPPSRPASSCSSC